MLISASGGSASAQSSSSSAGSSFAAQPGEASPPAPGIRGQEHERDRTLEIAPQPGGIPPDKGVEEVPSGNEYKPRQDTASLDRNFNPDGKDSGGRKRHKRPYIGIEVAYQTKCFLGQEEHGLEILKVDPDSPAAQSGLRATRDSGAAGIAEALLGPLALLVNRKLEQAQQDAGGDLIVAVNDHRVRSELDLDDEIDKLNPGDTMYVTVIRPLPGGNHKTMKIAIKVGKPGDTFADASASGGSSPSSSDGDEYAY